MNNKKLVKVMFAIPNEGHTEPEAYDNRMQFCCHLGALQVLSFIGETEHGGLHFEYPKDTVFEFNIATIGKTFTALARETIVEVAVDSGMDYLLMIDDDMITPMNIFERLYAHQKEVVAALAFSRYPPFKPVIYELREGYDHVKKSPYFVNYAVLAYPKNKLVECDAVGFGAVLIDCKVFPKMEKPWFMSTSASGEDILFCHKARKAGIRVFMDTSLKIGHLGVAPIITEEDYESQADTKEVRDKYGEISKYG